MSLTKPKLDDYKRDLLARREALQQEIRLATEELINEEPQFADSVDQAAADTDRSLQVQFKNRDRGILYAIDEALRRIDLGQFGDCGSCGDEIGEARIRANPSTTLCIDCQSELESERGRIPR
jgi:DnaK suppressor protein